MDADGAMSDQQENMEITMSDVDSASDGSEDEELAEGAGGEEADGGEAEDGEGEGDEGEGDEGDEDGSDDVGAVADDSTLDASRLTACPDDEENDDDDADGDGDGDGIAKAHPDEADEDADASMRDPTGSVNGHETAATDGDGTASRDDAFDPDAIEDVRNMYDVH